MIVMTTRAYIIDEVASPGNGFRFFLRLDIVGSCLEIHFTTANQKNQTVDNDKLLSDPE